MCLVSLQACSRRAFGLVALVMGLSCMPALAQVAAHEPRGESAIVTHMIDSQFQPTSTKIRILSPSKKAESQEQVKRIVFLLPVEARDEERYGNGLREVERLKLHDRHHVICVAPTFSQLPWYADHPTDSEVQQESHLIRVVLPKVDKLLGVEEESTERYLLGFSKSGWGAWSLLLRNPKLFERAAAWDAPLNMERYGRFGSAPIFGTQENFRKYHVPTLLKQQAADLGKTKRLVLTGYDGFRKHHVAVHALMTKHRIRCDYRDGPRRKHRWDSGWLPEAFELLLPGEMR